MEWKFTKELSELISKHGITTTVALFSNNTEKDIVLIQGTSATILIGQITLAHSVFESLERRLLESKGLIVHDSIETIQ